MVVCNFFLKGSCKFGDRCRNEHPRGGGGGGYNQSRGNQNYYSSNYGGGGQQQQQYQGNNRGFGDQRTFGNYGGGGQQRQDQYHWKSGQQQQTSGRDQAGNNGKKVSFHNSFGTTQNRFGALDPAGGGGGVNTQKTDGQDLKPNEIIDIIKKDIEEWEGSNMWPLSCYKPTRSQHCVPGFEDITTDELRFAAYSAEKQQKFEIYKSTIVSLMNTVQRQKDQLKTPDNALSTQLVDIFKGIYQAGSTTSLGNGDSMFQALATACGADTSHPPATASAQQGKSFGAGTTPAAPTPGFGITPTATPAPANTPGFGGAPAAAAPTGFGANTGFGSAASGSAFGSNPPPNGLFGKGGSAQVSATQPPTGLFGKGVAAAAPEVAPGTGLFGKGTSAPAAVGGTGLFGKPANMGGGLFSQGQNASAVDSSLYTPISELTQEEKDQFEADIFTIGKIPTRPPPVELIR